MEVLYFAFANNHENPLPSLQKESDELFKLLSPGELDQRYQIIREQYATRTKIVEHLTQYKDSITLFHYSGHAGKEGLLTEEGATHADGIAHLLGQCKNLKWVFLNGCSTGGQVKQLLEKGIPGVIATSAPVEDEKATNFSIRFYHSLSLQNHAETAFESAKGDVLSMFEDGQPKLDIPLHRDFVWSGANINDNGEGTWGTFVSEKQEAILKWKLPEIAVVKEIVDYVPNEGLITTIIKALAPFDKTARRIIEDEEEGDEIDFADKRLAILNGLPAPIAEHLRKLMVPLADKDKGYDKVSLSRIDQLAKTYNATLEIFFFSLLAQLWSALEEKPDLKIPDTNRKTIYEFFTVDSNSREYYDYIPMIKSVREIFDINDIPYFIEDFEAVRKTYAEESPFYLACEFLDSLKRRLVKEEVGEHEVPTVCQRAEESLSEVFSTLSAMAKYTFAAVRKIDVVKFRHSKSATFRHSVVNLVKLMGGLEEKTEELENFMDSRSVLMLKTKDGKQEYLNLSPFIIDENAYDDKTSDISKIYFFHHWDKNQDKYVFLHAGKPEDPPLVVGADNKKFAMVKMQFEAFYQLMFSQDAATAA